MRQRMDKIWMHREEEVCRTEVGVLHAQAAGAMRVANIQEWLETALAPMEEEARPSGAAAFPLVGIEGLHRVCAHT